MKRFFTFLFILSITTLVSSQNYLRGDFNSFGTSDALVTRGAAETITKTGISGSNGYKFANSAWSSYNHGLSGAITANDVQNCYHNSASNTTFSFTSSKYYTFNFIPVANANTQQALLETDYNPTTFNGTLSRIPASGPIYGGSTTTKIIATLSVAPNSGENVFLRYSTNNFVSSTLVKLTFPYNSNSLQGSADITPIGTASTTVKYYVFTSPVAAATITGGGVNAYDLLAMQVENNSGNNYQFTTDAVLSSELIGFKATTQSLLNILSWVTSSEKDNANFNIQRSTNNQSWQTIGTVKATNNPSGAKYNFTDDAPLSTINYYRLQMVSTDGKIDYSKVVSVSGKEGKQTLSVYPNPVKEELNVLTDGTTEGISIYDMTGKIVRQYNDNRSKVNVQDLPNGIYFVRLLDKSGLVGEAVRFVKQ